MWNLVTSAFAIIVRKSFTACVQPYASKLNNGSQIFNIYQTRNIQINQWQAVFNLLKAIHESNMKRNLFQKFFAIVAEVVIPMHSSSKKILLFSFSFEWDLNRYADYRPVRHLNEIWFENISMDGKMPLKFDVAPSNAN